MSRYKQFSEELLSVLVPALMAGCTVHVAAAAIGFAVSPLLIYAAALISAGAVMFAGRGTAWMITAIGIPVGGTIICIAAGAAPIRAFIGALQSGTQTVGELAAANPSAGLAAALPSALIVGAATALLCRSHIGRPFALLLPILSILLSLTFAQTLSVWAALPGIAGCIAAFAESESFNPTGVKPAAAAACLCIALMGMILAPASGTSWEPLRQLAERIRSITDEYIHFTSERVAFSINEKGYDHGGMISDTVVTMLGGKANPTDDEVMRVTTDTDILLRGTIKQTYTGYSWVDERVKARYLYYDFTHAGTRDEIFGADDVKNNEAFRTVQIGVSMSEEATSTLFVPAHMSEFSMDLADAVYYNSVGEIFLTRDVESGDTYTLSAQVPRSDDRLIAAAAQAENSKDAGYASAQSEYTGLPDGIDEQVYALSMSITQGLTTNAEKAIAIRRYLAANYKYTLDAGYPDQRKDFVSWFLLEEKKGYCSYFATAMTVLCRIAGVPARYVEGYFVRADADGESVVTGRNAHAWVEVYLSGIGWTAFDPTAAAYRSQNGLPEEDVETSPNENSGLGGSTPEQAAAGSTDGTSDDSGEDGGSDQPDGGETPDDGSGSSGDENTDGSGSDSGSDNSGDGDNSDSGADNSGGSDSSDGDSQNDGDSPDTGDDSQSGSDSPDSENPDDSNEPESTDPPENDPEQQNNPETDPPKTSPWIWIAAGILLLAALIALAVLWVRKRLISTDPLRMCKKSRDARKASMILYRAILTLLLQLGFAPMNGETPEDFAARVCQNIPNDAYVRFVAAAARSTYSGGSVKRSELEDGRDAYLAFLAGMKPMEKLRYNARRVLYGIGDTESIP